MTSKWKFIKTYDEKTKTNIEIVVRGLENSKKKIIKIKTGEYSKNGASSYTIRVHHFQIPENKNAYYLIKHGHDTSEIECMLIISKNDSDFSILYQSYSDTQESPKRLLSPFAHGTLAHFSYLLFKNGESQTIKDKKVYYRRWLSNL